MRLYTAKEKILRLKHHKNLLIVHVLAEIIVSQLY